MTEQYRRARAPHGSLIELWHPVTHEMGLIHAPVEDVVYEDLKWARSSGHHYRRKEITSSLTDAFDSLEPLCALHGKKLFVSTKAGWTAFFQNGIAGSDPFMTLYRLGAERMRVQAMRVVRTPPDAVWPAVMWEVFAPTELGGIPPFLSRRVIAASNDGGRWVFHTFGEPFEFERLERYEARRKRDRFTPEMLDEYLGHFGLEPFSDDFYQVSKDHPAILLQRQAMFLRAPGIKRYTLEEVRAGKPWQP